MNRWTLTIIVAAGLAIGCAPSPPGSEKPVDVPRYPAGAFFETVTFLGNSFSHDEEQLLVTSDGTGIFNVYGQPFAGGESSQLTESETESIFGVSWFPEDNRFVYNADEGGNELDHLYVRELDGGVVDLTPGESLKASFVGWSGDRASFYVSINERDAAAFDVYRYATDGYDRKRMFKNDGRFLPGPVSDDGRWLALRQPISSADSDVSSFGTPACRIESANFRLGVYSASMAAIE